MHIMCTTYYNLFVPFFFSLLLHCKYKKITKLNIVVMQYIHWQYEKRKKKERKICAQDKCGKWYHKKLNCTIMYAKYLFTCESVIPDNICICCVVRREEKAVGVHSKCLSTDRFQKPICTWSHYNALSKTNHELNVIDIRMLNITLT